MSPSVSVDLQKPLHGRAGLGRRDYQRLIDMVVAARALAELRLVSVFALIPPTTHHHPPPTHPN